MKKQTIEQKIQMIEEAIYDGVAVVIENYLSKKSKTCRTRKVFPIKIKGDNVLCLDIEAGEEQRMFKFEWMQGNVYVM